MIFAKNFAELKKYLLLQSHNAKAIIWNFEIMRK